MTRRAFALAAAIAAAASIAPAATSSSDQQATARIRAALLRLPYYGVFDFLAFSYDKGTVGLSGYAYRPQLKAEATRAVERLAGVDEVIARIEDLSIAPHDEEIRWRTFYTIYNDTVLSRYAPGGALFRIDRRFGFSRLPGMQPLGSYPIHIVVNNGRILLAGAVDSEADRTIAGLRARGVPGAFGVENALEVTR
jgi:hyperosmotically inducible periplasmic protein